MITVTFGSAMNAADARPTPLSADQTLRLGPVDTHTMDRIIRSSAATSAVENTDSAGPAPKYAATMAAVPPPQTSAFRDRLARRASVAIAWAIASVVRAVNSRGTARSGSSASLSALNAASASSFRSVSSATRHREYKRASSSSIPLLRLTQAGTYALQSPGRLPAGRLQQARELLARAVHMTPGGHFRNAQDLPDFVEREPFFVSQRNRRPLIRPQRRQCSLQRTLERHTLDWVRRQWRRRLRRGGVSRPGRGIEGHG